MGATAGTTAPQSPATGGGGGGGGGSAGGPPVHQFRDTTYTKVFVGGLAWETQRETMRRHFEQYGEIVEAVVIMDKNTGRSKGYGFVTFRDAEGARKACLDATPVIDGRRANCNLASLGAHRSRPATPLHGNRMMGGMSPYSAGAHGGGVPTFMGSPAYPHQPFYPNYQIYGFSPYSQDYGYQQGMFNPYGAPQYPAHMYAGSTMYNPYGSMQTYMQPMQGGTGGMGGTLGSGPAGGGQTYPFSTSSPGGSSTNSSGSSYHGGASAASPLSNMTHYGVVHSGATIANMPGAAPPLLPTATSAGMIAGSSPPLFAIPSTIQQQLAVPSVIGEQPST
ncbi:hypothetical protein GOP47_0027252 [Adiantum capillus-veneris]|nr:hypothetical protein GOP47_0027252 [Adiantum capillus-veneris]